MTRVGFTFNQTAYRPPPKLPTRSYKTYRVMSPLSTHYRKATCAEAGCKAYAEGWTYKKRDLEAENLLYIVTHAGKRYREMQLTDEAEMYLVFEPGQTCFQASTHVVPLDRPEFYFMGRGDFRSFSTRKANKFERPADWVDSFANHVDHLHTAIERG